MPVLILKKKAEVLAEYRISRKNVISIGSAKGNDIVIKDKNVSENHCTITKKSGKYEINDAKMLMSTTVFEIKDNNTLAGTRVNEKTINVAELRLKDVVSIGSHTLIFLLETQKDENNSNDEVVREIPHYLLGVYGKFEGKKYNVMAGETNIGRENLSPRGVANNIVLSGDMTVSKGHSKIVCHDNNCILTDVGSTGGVAVNGKKLGQLNSVTIKNDDEIAIGRTIFRFVNEGNDNYSVPKKHDIFLLKLRRPFQILIIAAVLFSGIFASVKGLSSISIINSNPKKMAVAINRFWSPEENIVRTAVKEYGISSSPAIGDLNKNGVNDIVYLNSSGLLYAWDGKKGSQLWAPIEIFNSGKSSPVIKDMNNDSILDIIVISDNSMLYIIDGQSGGIIKKEILGGTIADLSPLVCDLDGDGKQDVVICSEEGMVHFVYSPGFDTESEKYAEFVEGPVYATPVLLTTEKISPMVVVCSNNSKIFLFDGKTREKKTIDLEEKTGKVHLIASSPAIGDLNGDGIPEIVVVSNVPQYLSVIDMAHFDVSWTYFVEPIPPAGLKHISSPVITDCNSDGLDDIVWTSANGFVYALKGKTGYPSGELLWKTEIGKGNRLIGSPALYDFDKNGIVDVVFGSEDGNIYIVKSSPERKEMSIMLTVMASNAQITSSLAIGDTNGDGKIEIVFSSINDVVQIINTNWSNFKSAIIWPMYLGSSYHGGTLEYKENIKPYVIMVVSGFAVCIMLIILIILVKQKAISRRPRVSYL